MWLLLLLVLTLWAPWAQSGWSIPALTDADEATGFLETLWQVDAAAIALTLAVVLFSFETTRTARGHALSLPQFASEIGLWWVLGLSVAALFGIGLVLLDVGSGAPAGYAATTATVWSAAALLSLPLLLVRTLTSTDPAALRQRWLKQLGRDALADTDDRIVDRVADVVLQREAHNAGVQSFGFWPGDPAPGAIYVYSGRSGVVRDIRIHRLRRIGSGDPVTDATGPVPALLVSLGKPVGSKTPVAMIARDSSARVRRNARKLAKVGTASKRVDLTDVIDQLHEDALDALVSGRPSSYQRVTDAYIELFHAIPAAWTRYGVTLEGHVATDPLFAPRPPLTLLSDNLFEELREATRGESREIARRAFVLPYRIALRSIETGARAILVPMINLYVLLYEDAKGARDPDIRRVATTHVVDIPLQITRISLAYELEREDLDDERRELLERMAHDAFAAIAELAKSAMDFDRADMDVVAGINGGWSQVFAHWNPEFAEPDAWEVDRARADFGEDDPRTVELVRRAAIRDRMAKTKDDLVSWRAALRFGLAFWAVHELRKTQDANWRRQHEALRGYFGSIAALTQAADAALGAGDHTPWFFWRLNQDRRRGPGAGPATDRELLSAYLTMAVFLVEPRVPAPTIDKPGFLDHSLDTVEQLITQIRGDARLWAILPPPTDIDRRWVIVRRMLRNAAATP